MRRILASILLLLAGTAAAEIYKKQLPDGSISYSDQPDPQAETIAPPPVQTYTPRSEPRPAPTPAPRVVPEAPSGYSGLAIAAPENDGVIWDDTGKVEIALTIDPALDIRQGHRVVVRLDGIPVQEPSVATRYLLTDVDRGTHRLQASVIDAVGQSVIDSPAVTFHVRRHSILHPRPP